MNTLTDTSLAAERVQIESIRAMSVGRRMSLMRSLTASTHKRAMQALRRARPHLSDVELRLWFIELNYGVPLANKVRAHIQLLNDASNVDT